LPNKAISAIMVFSNYLGQIEGVDGKRKKEAAKKMILLLAPFAPHLCEELWEKIGKKGFASLEKWPEFEAKLLNEEAEQKEELLEQIIADVRRIKEIVKIEKPKNVRLFVAEEWKKKALKRIIALKKEGALVGEGEAIKEAMKEEKARSSPKEAQMLAKYSAKKANEGTAKITEINELKFLEEEKEFLEKELGCKVEVIEAGKAKEEKAKNALPLKPAILLE